MRNPSRSLDTIESQATAWLARRDRGMSAAEKIEFGRWCAVDPRHAAAVNEISAVWAVFDRPTASGKVESLRAELHGLDRRRRHRWMAGGAATAFAAAACLAVFFGLPHAPAPKPVPVVAGIVTTRVIEPKRQTLPDGSIVEFRHDASIAVAFDDEYRVVTLKNGEAHFSVMKDPSKPFIVETGIARISAVGTAFAVGLDHAAVEVIVTEGRVRVDSTPPAPVRSGTPRIRMQETADAASAPIVEAGQRAVVPLGAVVPIPTVASIPVAELSERLSWRLPRLEFSETSVADAVAMFNRHNQRQLRIPDGAVAAMRITGVFRSDNVEGFVRALESSFGIQAERREREILLRSAM